MKKLNFDIPQPQIEINGEIYNILKSDADIFEAALDLEKRCRAIDKSDTEQILDACKKVQAFIDDILGKGALAKIAAGKPVSLMKGIEIMLALANAAVESYAGYIKEEYD